MENKSYFKSKFNLRTSDFSCYDKLYPHAILDLFQEVAGAHADILDIGFDKLFSRDLIWVLVRTKFEIVKNPFMHSEVEVMTWPKEKGKVDFDREYLILDNQGNTLVKGLSKWVIVNYKTRRISLTRDINYNCEIYQKTNFSEPFNKIEDFSIDNLPYLDQSADYISLDHNGHLNNINYAKYVMNILCLEKNQEIKTFEINYIKEVHKGQTIRNYYKKDNNIILIKGITSDNNTCYMAKVEIK